MKEVVIPRNEEVGEWFPSKGFVDPDDVYDDDDDERIEYGYNDDDEDEYEENFDDEDDLDEEIVKGPEGLN